MVVDTSSGTVSAHDVSIATTRESLPHQNHGAGNEQTPADGDDTTVADGLLQQWKSTTWWQKPILLLKLMGCYVVLLGLYGLFMVLGSLTSEDKERAEWKRRKQDQRSSRPSALSIASPSQLPQTTHPSRPQSSSAASPTSLHSIFLRRVYRTLLGYVPLMAYALVAWIFVKFGDPPRQNQQICLARQTEDGFIGNPDIYGLGIRLGIYIQWMCVTFTAKFLPSARKYVVSGYLLYHLGMIVAMCLLFSPATCTFTAEFKLVLQFIWGGLAIALVPTVNKKTKYDPKSKYLEIDMLTTILGILVFIFSSWTSLRLFFHGRNDFTATPGEQGTIVFWMTPLGANDQHWYAKFQLFWLLMKTQELYEVVQHQPRDLLISSFLDWNFWFSVAMSTGTLVNSCQGLVVLTLYFLAANETVFKNFMGEDESTDKPRHKVTRVVCYITRGSRDLVGKVWWLTRHCLIICWNFLAVEYTVQENNIDGVRSLDSTGQILPLALSVATLLSVLYLWVKGFFNRSTETSNEEETTPFVLEQAIGFPTPTGRWI